MTSILPAWKLELIEKKKKKKEQDQRQKLEDERSRKVSIPEWKRSLLEKKKVGASDSPETREQAPTVNTVFGPRILKKTSEKTLSIATASQRPVTKAEDEEISKRKVVQENVTRNNGSALYSSPAVSNSCVTKAVEIPTEMEPKSNKLGSLQQKVEPVCESLQRSGVTSSKEGSKVSVTSEPQPEIKLDTEHGNKAPSVLSYRRMFEQPKTENKKEVNEILIVKNTESIKSDIKNDKRTTESKLDTANDKSQLQISNKSTGDNAQSIHLEKSTSLLASETNERKIASPPPTVAPRPYKSFVSTPPWLKNTSPKNVAFQVGKKSAQELLVPKSVNSEYQSSEEENTSKDFHRPDLDHKTVVVESDVKEKQKTLNCSDLVMPTGASEPCNEKPVETDGEKRGQKLVQDQTVQKYAIVKDSDSKQEQLTVKPGKESENLKYVLIDSRNELTPSNEKAVTVISTDSVSKVHNELVVVKEDQEGSADKDSHKGSIESLRSKFGPSVGFQRRTSSEENLFLKANQSEPIEHGSVLRRPGQSKRKQPAMVRWSADVLSLMSKSIDDDDDDMSTLSPRSDSKIPSANSSEAKRPPPPMKRWTADVLSVIPQPIDSDTSELKNDSPSNSLNRARSSSLSDVREEQGFDFFQHKSNVSQGIEHRMHKLIRKMSITETSIKAEGEDSDSVSDDDYAGFNDTELNSKEAPNMQVTLITNENMDHTQAIDTIVKEKGSQPPLFSPEPEIEPVFARKHSISHDIEHRVSELFHRQLSQQSDGDESEGERSLESDLNITTVPVVEKIQDSIPEKPKPKPAPMVSIGNSPGFVSPTTEEETKEEVVLESKPTKGSVHKLSALFGSSIWKPNKKDKSSSEDKPKDQGSVGSTSQKVPSTEKSDLKSSSAKKEDGKKSSRFSKSQKSEGKSEEKKEKEPSNVNIFPWFKKHDKEKEKSGGNKTTDIESKNQKKSSSISADEGADTLPIATHGLRPVRKTEKVEQRLVGKVFIISNASHNQAPPKGVYHKTKPSYQLPEQEKEKTSPKKMDNSKPADIKQSESKIPAIVTQQWNGNHKSPEPYSPVPITSIDEVPVSAIDIPESSDNDVTVIDIPASPDVRSAEKFVFFNGSTESASHTDVDVSVSVIDMPSPVAKEGVPNTFDGGYLEADELSDESDMDEVEGSYDFATGEVTHLVNGVTLEDDEDDEDEDDEDEDEDVPISYIGAVPRYPVPQVVFDSEPVQLKSCLSPKTERKKVSFKLRMLSYGQRVSELWSTSLGDPLF